MDTMPPSALSVLAQLHQLCGEASRRFARAALHVHDPEIRAVLEAGSQEHETHAHELDRCMGKADDTQMLEAGPDILSSDADEPELALAIAQHDEPAILVACIHAERRLLAACAEAANEAALSPEAAEFVREQTEDVAACHSLLRACCDRLVAHAV